MAVFKCKMCGANLNISENDRVCTCEYCGSTQTVPSINSDKLEGMYQRANQFRMNYDFDKAISLFELILDENPNDAEIYWSIFLCKYGISYVEDALSGKRIPTVNRFQYTSVYADVDYKAAIEHADDNQKKIYEQEVKVIAEIQKSYTEISKNESPFDVFICYKETDDSGRRAVDSVLANDIYHQLHNKGIKTFYSRITLEDKLGVDYEPYIFSALNSAKIMIVLGTRPEFFEAVWVKNEWARFISLINNGAEKTLIPAFRGMDPYDLPKEFSHLQALDMSKLGFMQDLIRGIEKILGKDEKVEKKKEVVETNIKSKPMQIATNFMVLGSWDSAFNIYEKILNNNAEDPDAYLGEILAENEAVNLQALEQKLIDKIEILRDEPEEFPSYACQDKSAKIANTYYVDGYYTRETILKNLAFDRTYKQKIDNYENYKLELEKEFKLGNYRLYLQFADENGKQSMLAMQARVIEAIEQAYEDRLKEEQDWIKQISERYDKFIDTKLVDIKRMSDKAASERYEDYTESIKIVKKSINEYDLRNAVSKLTVMGKFEQAEYYAQQGRNKLGTVQTSKALAEGVGEILLAGGKRTWDNF